jgi:hypothetical protein
MSEWEVLFCQLINKTLPYGTVPGTNVEARTVSTSTRTVPYGTRLPVRTGTRRHAHGPTSVNAGSRNLPRVTSSRFDIQNSRHEKQKLEINQSINQSINQLR